MSKQANFPCWDNQPAEEGKAVDEIWLFKGFDNIDVIFWEANWENQSANEITITQVHNWLKNILKYYYEYVVIKHRQVFH